MDEIKELTEYYRKSLKTELPDQVQREEKLRVSGFPFCGLKSAWKKMEKLQGLEAKATTNSDKEHYTGTGTNMHLVFQRWLGHHGKILGNWKCKCGYHAQLKTSNKCKVCKKEMEYEEITVRAFKHVSGHIDGVFLSKAGKVFVIDYKTTATRMLRSPFLPYAKNVAQIKSYCALLELNYNIKVDGWMLLYISRDTIKRFTIKGGYISVKEKKKVLERIKLFDDQYEFIQNVLPNRKKHTWKDMEWLIETKACKNRSYYSKYYGLEGCPLSGVCFTSPNLRKTVKTEYQDLVERLMKNEKR
jgi:hypothetical protein